MSETKEQSKHAPTVEHTRYGWFVDFDGFKSAMPDEQTARASAAVPELLEACIAARAFIPKNQEGVRNFVNAAIAKAEGC